MEAYTQTRADTRPSFYRLWGIVSIGGGISTVYGALQSNDSLITVGVIGICLGLLLIYRGRSCSLPIYTDMASVPSEYVAEDTVCPSDSVSDQANTLLRRLTACDEVEEAAVRPSPDRQSEFVEVQLNGPYVSQQFQRIVDDIGGVPRMAPFGSEPYYRVYILFS